MYTESDQSEPTLRPRAPARDRPRGGMRQAKREEPPTKMALWPAAVTGSSMTASGSMTGPDKSRQRPRVQSPRSSRAGLLRGAADRLREAGGRGRHTWRRHPRGPADGRHRRPVGIRPPHPSANVSLPKVTAVFVATFHTMRAWCRFVFASRRDLRLNRVGLVTQPELGFGAQRAYWLSSKAGPAPRCQHRPFGHGEGKVRVFERRPGTTQRVARGRTPGRWHRARQRGASGWKRGRPRCSPGLSRRGRGARRPLRVCVRVAHH